MHGEGKRRAADWEMNTPRLNKVTNMGVFCALLVIFIHGGVDKNAGGFAWWWSVLISDGLSRIAVPYFFVASGFFLAQHIGEADWWRRAVRIRIRTLLVPFAVWAILNWILLTPFIAYKGVREGVSVANALASSCDIVLIFGLAFNRPPAAVPLWFVRSLLIFILLSRILVWLMRRNATFFYLLLIGVCLVNVV